MHDVITNNIILIYTHKRKPVKSLIIPAARKPVVRRTYCRTTLDVYKEYFRVKPMHSSRLKDHANSFPTHLLHRRYTLTHVVPTIIIMTPVVQIFEKKIIGMQRARTENDRRSTRCSLVGFKF